MMDFLEPWQPVTDDEARSLVTEAMRELPVSHVLRGKRLRAVARRQDCDDVLFEVDDVGVAVVHLTWSRETDSRLPNTELYGSMAEWAEQRMTPDHEAFS